MSPLAPQIFAGGHISAHYNPAISLGVAIRHSIRMPDVPLVIVTVLVQLVAATIAALCGLYITNAVRVTARRARGGGVPLLLLPVSHCCCS